MLMTLKILYQDQVFPLNFKLRHLITHSTSLRGYLKDISDLMLQNSTPDPPSHANPHLSKPSPSSVFSPSSWQLLPSGTQAKILPMTPDSSLSLRLHSTSEFCQF